MFWIIITFLSGMMQAFGHYDRFVWSNLVTFYDKTDVNTLINGCFPVGLGYTLSAEIATLSGNIGTMSSNISTNYTTLSALITSVSGFVATNRTNISTLSGNITTMSSTISTDYATLSGLITSISGTLTSLSGKIQIIDYPATVPATSVSIAAITTAPNVVTLYNLEAGPTGYLQVAYDTKYAGQVIAIDVSPACASILGTAVSQGMLQEYVNLNTNNTLAGLNTFTNILYANNYIEMFPNISGQQAAISFYKNNDRSVNATAMRGRLGIMLEIVMVVCFRLAPPVSAIA